MRFQFDIQLITKEFNPETLKGNLLHILPMLEGVDYVLNIDIATINEDDAVENDNATEVEGYPFY